MTNVHPSAMVDPSARLGDNVEIGPGSIIGPDVDLGEGTIIGPHVVIKRWTRLGINFRMESGCVRGGEPQDFK